jgi:hypothetical protein
LINVADVILTYRSQILLRDGRVVQSCCDSFIGPLEFEYIEGGGAWYLAVYEGPRGDGAERCEWVSLRDIVEIRVVGDWDEWPLVQAGSLYAERPDTWPDYLPEGRVV